MRARRPGRERSIEIELEATVEYQVSVRHSGDVHEMIAFGMNLSRIVLVEKVI